MNETELEKLLEEIETSIDRLNSAVNKLENYIGMYVDDLNEDFAQALRDLDDYFKDLREVVFEEYRYREV